MDDSFEDVYDRYRAQIDRMSVQRLPGMTRDEVRQEIVMALWTAWKKFDPDRGASFTTLWYQAWMSRKSHALEAFFTRRRQMFANPCGDTEQMDAMLEAFTDVFPFDVACPVDDPLADKVWRLLAAGFQRKEVLSTLGIGWRRYERVMSMLNTPEVRAALV